MDQLDKKTLNKINSLAELGDQYAEEGEFAEAIKQYQSAWDFIPEPKYDWDAALWLLVAIGDAQFSLQKFDNARTSFMDALECPDALGNPFIHLRLGQCQFELKNHERAADELTRAYMGAGLEIFEGEEEKYFNYLKTVIEAPDGGW